jgi:cation:H+ antiporter
VAIYFACEYFVNGVEWFGRKLKLSATATGTVLAAFGTALPESAVTFVAVIFGKTPEARDIGVGAALGGPLVLATIAYAVVGGAVVQPAAAEASRSADSRRSSTSGA